MCIYFFPFFFAERRGFGLRLFHIPPNPHILPKASCAIRARIYSLKQAWTLYGIRTPPVSHSPESPHSARGILCNPRPYLLTQASLDS